MKNLPLVAVLAFVPMSANAQVRDSGSLLRGSMRALEQAGFAGMQAVSMPQAPGEASAAPLSIPDDETAEAVTALVDAAQKLNGAGLAPGETLRKLGIIFDDEKSPTKSLGAFDSDSKKYFTVIMIQGRKYVLIEEMRTVAAKKQLRSYLIGADGSLLAAAVTRKENGKYIAEPIPFADAAAGHREQLDFWVRYYRVNLKKP